MREKSAQNGPTATNPEPWKWGWHIRNAFISSLGWIPWNREPLRYIKPQPNRPSCTKTAKKSPQKNPFLFFPIGGRTLRKSGEISHFSSKLSYHCQESRHGQPCKERKPARVFRRVYAGRVCPVGPGYSGRAAKAQDMDMQIYVVRFRRGNRWRKFFIFLPNSLTQQLTLGPVSIMLQIFFCFKRNTNFHFSTNLLC